MNNFIAALLLLSNALLLTSTEEVPDATRYIDEVLSVYVPWAVGQSNLKVYQMPDFTTNFQNRSDDGRASTGKVYYFAGNLTGLQSVNRKMCNTPEWVYSNLTVKCNIVFPKISVKYEAKLHFSSPVTNGIRFRQRVFDVDEEIVGMEAIIELTASPLLKTPTIKSLAIVKEGTPSLRFGVDYEIPFEILSSHFYNKYSQIFNNLFDDQYRKALQRAAESLPFPF